MSRDMPARRFRRILCIAAMSAPVLAGGCVVNLMALPYFLMGGDARQQPIGVTLVTGKKETRKVAVLSYADFGLRNGHGNIDDELASVLTAEIAKGEDRLLVVPDRKVRQWRDQNPGWLEMDLQKIGEKLGVDYVIFFEINEFSVSDPKNPYLFQGNASVLFRVHDVNKESVIFNDRYERDYPPNRPVPVTDVASEDQFRRMFIRRIAEELSWYVVPHNAVNPIGGL